MTERVDFIFYGGMYRNAALDPIGKMMLRIRSGPYYQEDPK